MNDNTNGKQVNWGFIFIITILFGVIAVAFLTLLAIGGFLWLDMKEDWRGSEAWRQKQIYDEKEEYRKKCENAVLRQHGLIEVYKQSNRPIPPELLLIEDCGTNKRIEEK